MGLLRSKFVRQMGIAIGFLQWTAFGFNPENLKERPCELQTR